MAEKANSVKAIVRKTNQSLFPADQDAQQIFAQLPNSEILIDIKTDRSVQNHKRFFAFVNKTFEWQEDYILRDVWRKVLLIRGGHFDTVVDKKNNTHFWAKSISFAELGNETKFKQLFNDVIQGYIKSPYWAGLSSQQQDMVVVF